MPTDSLPQILAIIATVFTALAGVIGGVVAWRKNRTDERTGVSSSMREDQAAWDARYAQLLDQIQEHHLDPMREDLKRLRDEVATLRTDLAAERAELREERTRYRAALTHIRALTGWIAAHMPPGTPPMPTPPDSITDDLP